MNWRPRRFRLGKMRERITVQSATETFTDGQVSRTWADLYANEPAAFEPAVGGETVRGRQVEADTKAVFIVRYKSGYSTEQRVQFDNLNWGITNVVRVDGGNRYLELHCRAIPS